MLGPCSGLLEVSGNLASRVTNIPSSNYSCDYLYTPPLMQTGGGGIANHGTFRRLVRRCCLRVDRLHPGLRERNRVHYTKKSSGRYLSFIHAVAAPHRSHLEGMFANTAGANSLKDDDTSESKPSLALLFLPGLTPRHFAS